MPTRAGAPWQGPRARAAPSKPRSAARRLLGDLRGGHHGIESALRRKGVAVHIARDRARRSREHAASGRSRAERRAARLPDSRARSPRDRRSRRRSPRRSAVSLFPALPVARSDTVPRRLIERVIASRERVVIEDAAADPEAIGARTTSRGFARSRRCASRSCARRARSDACTSRTRSSPGASRRSDSRCSTCSLRRPPFRSTMLICWSASSRREGRRTVARAGRLSRGGRFGAFGIARPGRRPRARRSRSGPVVRGLDRVRPRGKRGDPAPSRRAPRPRQGAAARRARKALSAELGLAAPGEQGPEERSPDAHSRK